MAYPFTKKGFNIYELMSLMQKGIRRGLFNEAGFGARHLKDEYRSMMWNRLFVISAEDCFGIITKELVELHEQDQRERDDTAVSKAVALMCKSRKSRDGCYFSCNFILSTRKPRDIEVSEEECRKLNIVAGGKTSYDTSGFMQIEMNFDDEDEYDPRIADGVRLQKALNHLDMDMAGFYANEFRKKDRDFLWRVLIDNANGSTRKEVIALKEADDIVNKNRKDKDEIFLAKACIVEMYAADDGIEDLFSSEIVGIDLVDWNKYQVNNVNECEIPRYPEWVFDCHTLKGKKMGKTDWDMTVTEQAALFPLAEDYFSDASWIYIYEDDYKNGVENDKTMAPIREFAKTHLANPVKFIPY